MSIRRGRGPAEGTSLARAARARRRPRLGLFLLSLFVAIGSGGRAGAQATGSVSGLLTIEETEALVRRVHFEGMSEDEAARIGPEGGRRLIEMLGDPEEKPHHARILLALGSWGGAGALEAVAGWAPHPTNAGDLDRDSFRAWQVRPHALGRLARRDARALAGLSASIEADSPGWSFRHFDGPRLQALERRAAAAALAESGLPEADGILEAAARRSTDPAWIDHVRAVRAEAAARVGSPR